jgi:hypothetical protein
VLCLTAPFVPKYFVFIKSLKPSYIPCCVRCSGLAGHSLAFVCARKHAEKRWAFNYCCFDYYNKFFVVCYSFNSWFSADIICEISHANASTYSLFRMGESCVAYYITCTDVGGPSHTYSCNYSTELSSASAHIILLFISIWVVIHFRFDSTLLQGFM